MKTDIEKIMTDKEECREQIQEDIIAYAAISTVPTKEVDALCQIVVDNFEKLED